MSTAIADTPRPSKPIPLRAIFILNGLMMFLPFVFYIVFKTQNIELEGVDPTRFLYTGAGYIVTFALLVTCILKRWLWGLRLVIGLNVIVALPAKAYIGILISVLSLSLSFHPKVRAYFDRPG